jgi:hypothetical protein
MKMDLSIIITLMMMNFIISCSSTVIKKNLPLCELTTEIISLEDRCNTQDIECQFFMSQIDNAQENTFNKIEILKTQVVIYKKNNKVFNTNCQIVNEIVIEQGISFADKNTCTQMLPVKYGSEKQVAFLRKDGVLVKDFAGTKCPVQDELFVIDDREFLLSGICFQF